ncbi:hypothetical protein GCM10027299_34490 [Larkinella ripae]
MKSFVLFLLSTLIYVALAIVILVIMAMYYGLTTLWILLSTGLTRTFLFSTSAKTPQLVQAGAES